MYEDAQKYFSEHVLVLSGMYGILKPNDTIANYKLPIDSKGLKAWRGDKITDALIEYAHGFEEVVIVDLLSGAYQKMLDRNKIREQGIKYVQVNFMKSDEGVLKKYTHGVKKVKGEKLREWCEEEGLFKELLEGEEEVIEVVV